MLGNGDVRISYAVSAEASPYYRERLRAEELASAEFGLRVAASEVQLARAALEGRPGWRNVPAVRAGRVHAVDPDRVNRPGPGLARSAALLARLIHGPSGGRGTRP